MSKVSENPRKALGKGLSALIVPRPHPAASSTPLATHPPDGAEVLRIKVEQIDPNPLQSRTIFQADKLDNWLTQSSQRISALSAAARNVHFAGTELAGILTGGLGSTCCIQNLTIALTRSTRIENIQREDLTPIEAAHAFDRLVKDLGLSHEEIGRRTGKDRTTITNLLRLLRLPSDVQQLVTEHRLSMGHARAILGLPSEELQRQVAEKATSQGLSVRQVERLIQRMTESREPKTPEEVALDPNVKAAIAEMERILGTRVRIQQKSDHRGRIEIEYYSTDDLDRIYSIIVTD